MADNVVLPGTGVVVLSDDVGSGVQAQVVKAAFGSDGTATQVSATSPLPVMPPVIAVSGSASSAADVIASQDLLGGGYASLYFTVTGTFTATVRLQGSHDNTNWNNVTFNSVSVNPYTIFTQPSSVTSGSTGNCYQTAPTFRYYKIAVSAYTSGTVSATMILSVAPASVTPVMVQGTATGATFYTAPSVTNGPADGSTLSYAQAAAFPNFGFNGTNYDRHRLAKVFKSVTATASGDTTVWTPTSGKRVQLLKVQFFATSDAQQASGGVITVKLRDNTTDTGISVPVYVPTVGGVALGGWTSGMIDVGPYGFRSSAINTTLNVNISAALTAGSIGVVAMGCEE